MAIFLFNKLLALAVLILLCAACSAPPENSVSSGSTEPPVPTQSVAFVNPTEVVDHLPPTAMPTVEWTSDVERLQSNMLGANCATPCFFGIKPNVTTADAVPTILSQLKEEGLVEDFYLRRHPNSGTSYTFLFSIGSGGGIGIDEDSNLVTWINFGLSLKLISLRDLIAAYGEPELVAYGAGDSFEGLYLGYQEKQIFAWARTDFFGDQMVSPEMTITTLSYFPPNTPDSALEQPYVVWLPWEGYQQISYYYQKLEEARNQSDN